VNHRIKMISAAALLAVSLTACYGRNTGNPPNQSQNYGAYGTDGRMADGNRDGAYDGMLLTSNSNVQWSQQIADQLAAMDEVKSANVLVTDDNAYVAVTLHSGYTMAPTGQGTTGGNAAGAGAAGGNAAGAGVGAQDVSQEIKNKVADKVRSIKPNIRNVYVSANPDFVERMNAYVQDVRNGRPIAGLVNEFNNMIMRVFPSNAGHAGGTTGTQTAPTAPTGR